MAFTLVVIALRPLANPVTTASAQQPNVQRTRLAAAVVSPQPLLGTWSPASPTRGLVKLIITESGGGISVEAFGSCTPTPCVWPPVSGIVYAESVDSAPAVAFSAQYDFGFSRVIVVGHLQGPYLNIELFNEFTDSTPRHNYYSTERMVQ